MATKVPERSLADREMLRTERPRRGYDPESRLQPTLGRLRGAEDGNRGLLQRERQAAGDTGTALGGAANLAEKIPGPVGRAAKVASFFLGNGKKKAGSGIAGLLAALVVFMFTIGTGPLKLIHLSQILQKATFGQEEDSLKGKQGLLRYARTGQPGQTRVNFLGSRQVDRVVKQLNAKGFNMTDPQNTSKLTGRLRTISINTQAEDSPFKDVRPAERKAAILKAFELEDRPELLKQTSQNVYEFTVDQTTKEGQKLGKALTKGVVGSLDTGKAETAINFRLIKKFTNQSGLFNPLLKRLGAKLEKRGETRIALRAKKRALAKERGEERLKALRESPIGIKAASARGKIGDSVNSNRSNIIKGLTVSGGYCLIRTAVGFFPAANDQDRAFAEITAEHSKAVGSKLQDGLKVDADSLGLESDELTPDKKGPDIFASRELQALSGKASPSGPELSNDDKGVFTDEPSSDLAAINGAVGSIACDPISLGLQVIAGAALAYNPATGWEYNALRIGGAAAISGVIINKFLNEIEDYAKDKNKFEFLGDPRHGGLLAEAAISSAGRVGRSEGAVKLSSAAVSELDQRQKLVDQQDFQSKSFASRMFDVYDQRSLASNIIDHSDSDVGQGITNVASSLMNVRSFASSLFATFTPRAYAANTPFKFASSRYGIPPELLDVNPYDNADKVESLLNDGKIDTGRAKTCFGVDLKKDEADRWASIPDDESTNPQSEEYKNAHCDDLGGTATIPPLSNWKRTIAFVFYDRLVVIDTCKDGEPTDPETIAACKELGFPISDSGPNSADTTSDAPSVSGDVQKLAQDILDLEKDKKISIADYSENPSADKATRSLASQQLTDIAAGKEASLSTRCSYTLPKSVAPDPKILQFLVDLGQDEHYKLNVLFGQCHSGAGSAHHQGKAADFGCPLDTSKGDAVGKKYGVSHNGEACGGLNNHWHYSVGGG